MTFSLRAGVLLAGAALVAMAGWSNDAQAQITREINLGTRAIQPEEGGEDLFLGLRGRSLDLPVTAFPGDMFSPAQRRQLQAGRIATARDLVAANPAQLGRILGLSQGDARRLQEKLRNEMR